VSLAVSITDAKFAYSLTTTRYGWAAIAVLTGDTRSPIGRVPRVCPDGRRSIHRVTVFVEVLTTATRKSG